MTARFAPPPPWLKINGFGRLEISPDKKTIYGLGHLIRTVEQSFLSLFDKGQLSGTVHTSLGQEVCALGIVHALNNSEDAIFSGHRNHAHFLAYCGRANELIAEVMGKEGGVCCGRGGSQHVSFLNFHSSGVQAGLCGISVGVAAALKKRPGQGLAAIILGDGSTGEGLLYESMNMASIWQVPLLFIIEDNGIAQTTNTAFTIGGSILARGDAFGLPTWHLSDRDPEYVLHVQNIVAELRQKRTPGYLVIKTARMGPHSKGDDSRTKAEKDEIIQRDPLNALGESLSKDDRQEIERTNTEYVSFLVDKNMGSKDARLSHTEFYGQNRQERHPVITSETTLSTAITVGQSLNNALRKLLNKYPEVLLLGEDLHDPYGGAFKITKQLSSEFPERVISAPISEAAIVGAAIGLAMRGYVPIVEIMFADFLTLCMDQIYNHAVKFPWIYPESKISMVIRTPGGGNRGYGPTHSQSMESLFCSVPGLTVIAGSHRHDVEDLLVKAATQWQYPVIFMENKLLYAQKQAIGRYHQLGMSDNDIAHDMFPTLVRGDENESDLTIVTYGGNLPMVENVADYLEANEEISVEIVVPALLAPMPVNSLVPHLMKRKRILIVEETPNIGGFAAGLISALAMQGYRGQVTRLGAAPVPIPAARSAERQVLPQNEDVLAAIKKLLSS